jgi:hypothetical protein
MADPNSPPPADPRATAPTADNRVTGARTAPAPATGAQVATNDPASADLDAFVDNHLRNSRLSQRTDLYNEAQAHVRALKELLSQAAS